MGIAALQIKVMPTSPEVDLEKLKKDLEEKIIQVGAIRVEKTEEQDVAFGLKAVIITIAWPEEQETDKAEAALKEVENVSSVDTIDYRRAFG